MRVDDLDLSADPWEYWPRSHKTEHRGKRRVIVLGPRAQELLRPLLVDDPEACVFRPSRPKSRRYHPQSLRTAVLRACKRVNAERTERGLAPIPVWHPHQLRHAAATRFRHVFGVEVARAALGHATPEMTEHYAERDLRAVRELAAAIG